MASPHHVGSSFQEREKVAVEMVRLLCTNVTEVPCLVQRGVYLQPYFFPFHFQSKSEKNAPSLSFVSCFLVSTFVSSLRFHHSLQAGRTAFSGLHSTLLCEQAWVKTELKY